jgi:predicted ATPase with chaperone activity
MDLCRYVGPAISSGKAMFFYGPSGNSKTAIAKTIGALLPETVFIPYSITVGGQVIIMYDPGQSMKQYSKKYARAPGYH